MVLRIFILSLGFLFLFSGLKSQTLIRKQNETAEQFALRYKPENTELAHTVIETNTWDSGKKAIIALYGFDDPADPNYGYNKIYGKVYLPVESNQYRAIIFGPIDEDGGYPEVLAVFFANADKDADKELCVLCKYDQRHYDYSGDLYETFIFDNPSEKSNLTYFQKLSESFSGCDCDWRDGKSEKAKYKTARDVKAGLKKLGY